MSEQQMGDCMGCGDAIPGEDDYCAECPDPAVPPRPAAPDNRAHNHTRFRNGDDPWSACPTTCPLAAPDAAAGDELRSAITEALTYWYPDSGTGQAHTDDEHLEAADAVLALPALRDVLAERDRLRARVESIHVSDDAETPFCDECGHAWPCLTIRALDGAS